MRIRCQTYRRSPTPFSQISLFRRRGSCGWESVLSSESGSLTCLHVSDDSTRLLSLSLSPSLERTNAIQTCVFWGEELLAGNVVGFIENVHRKTRLLEHRLLALQNLIRIGESSTFIATTLVGPVWRLEMEEQHEEQRLVAEQLKGMENHCIVSVGWTKSALFFGTTDGSLFKFEGSQAERLSHSCNGSAVVLVSSLSSFPTAEETLLVVWANGLMKRFQCNSTGSLREVSQWQFPVEVVHRVEIAKTRVYVLDNNARLFCKDVDEDSEKRAPEYLVPLRNDKLVDFAVAETEKQHEDIVVGISARRKGQFVAFLVCHKEEKTEGSHTSSDVLLNTMASLEREERQLEEVSCALDDALGSLHILKSLKGDSQWKCTIEVAADAWSSLQSDPSSLWSLVSPDWPASQRELLVSLHPPPNLPHSFVSMCSVSISFQPCTDRLADGPCNSCFAVHSPLTRVRVFGDGSYRLKLPFALPSPAPWLVRVELIVAFPSTRDGLEPLSVKAKLKDQVVDVLQASRHRCENSPSLRHDLQQPQKHSVSTIRLYSTLKDSIDEENHNTKKSCTLPSHSIVFPFPSTLLDDVDPVQDLCWGADFALQLRFEAVPRRWKLYRSFPSLKMVRLVGSDWTILAHVRASLAGGLGGQLCDTMQQRHVKKLLIMRWNRSLQAFHLRLFVLQERLQALLQNQDVVTAPVFEILKAFRDLYLEIRGVLLD